MKAELLSANSSMITAQLSDYVTWFMVCLGLCLTDPISNVLFICSLNECHALVFCTLKMGPFLVALYIGSLETVRTKNHQIVALKLETGDGLLQPNNQDRILVSSKRLYNNRMTYVSNNHFWILEHLLNWTLYNMTSAEATTAQPTQTPESLTKKHPIFA